ncbi:MAG: hypothetical protein MPW14_24450 [Candidatus Manganitrophus sp.]|nr:MAG: hypothetical protein MPW14_24450 [Candidatus Manganitrophus sp.]
MKKPPLPLERSFGDPASRYWPGRAGTVEVARMAESDLVVSGMVGGAGLLPTFSAVQSGKSVALANKETLVMAGEIIQREARLRRVQILPIDSEHSAIFQVMVSERPQDVRRIILTASGGRFFVFPTRRSGPSLPERRWPIRHGRWVRRSRSIPPP